MRKHTVLLLIACLVLSSLMVALTVKPVIAQKPSPPSVPKFSVKLVSHPYDVSPTSTSTFDTSTWIETITTKPGYREENRSIEVTIKNQPFTPYTLHTSERGYAIDLYYTVEVKDHFSEDWQSFRYSVYSYCYEAQSNSDYTVVSGSADYSVGTRLDFRVQAVIGYRYSATADSLASMFIGPVDSMSFSTSSSWSGIQTITITSGSSMSSSQTTTLPPPSATFEGNYTQSPNQIQQINDIFTNTFFLFGVVVLFAGVVIVVVLVVLRRYIKTPTYPDNSTQTNATLNSH
jgi:hypothetical protein